MGSIFLVTGAFREKNGSRILSTKDKVTGPFPSGRTDGAAGEEPQEKRKEAWGAALCPSLHASGLVSHLLRVPTPPKTRRRPKVVQLGPREGLGLLMGPPASQWLFRGADR